MMKKFVIALLVFGLVGLGGFFWLRPAVIAWMTSVPETAFDDTPVPAAPDYANEDHWAALPWRNDSADWLPRGSSYIDQQASADVDVFFVYPTAAFYGDYWVAGLDNLLHRFAVDFGILPQHASAFNGVGKIYAPRYRSVRMPIWWADDRDSVKKATDFAYADVRQAFEHYMKHWNKGRPLIIVSHSQGTLHTIRLLREYFDGKPLQKQLVAGYLVGNTIPDMPWFNHIPLCAEAEQTGCYVTWNTILEGGDPYHWVQEKGLDKIDCVNPLSWKADQRAVDKTENTGSIPMVSYGILFETLEPMDVGVVGARCGPEGILWIRNRPEVPGYSSALFGGGTHYHTYDINFFYDSIRQNAIKRAGVFMANHKQP
ncbi:MAG: DUF3089 domain-containing protein [Pseudomonadales bacterium]|nr:DUF3089 domain-containing protein [Pseudomonadales bacterium]